MDINITRYDNLKEYEKYTNTDVEEFNQKLEEGYVQTLTLGTYNGAIDEFTPCDTTKENIIDGIRQYLAETNQGTTVENIEEMAQFIFVIEETKDVYLDI